VGIEHSSKENSVISVCPACKRETYVYTYEQRERIFYCINQRCPVERIYTDNEVEIADGHE
jgi:serine protease inhibitor ecotin